MAVDEGPAPRRIADERAAKILERAAALDAQHSSELSLDQLREAAVGAGISGDAFDQAMREVDDAGAEENSRTGKGGRPVGLAHAFQHPEVARLAALLSDTQEDSGQLTVIGDRLEWRDGRGLVVSITPSGDGAAAMVAMEGELRTRLKAVIGASMVPLAFFFVGMVASEGEAAFVGGFFAVVFTAMAACIGTARSFRREQNRLEKRMEWMRDRLARALTGRP